MTPTDRRCFNPADGQPRPPRLYMTREHVDEALRRAATARAAWGASSFADRAAVLREAARLLRAERAALASLITLEMGKPIVEAESEIDKSAWNCEYVAEERADVAGRPGRGPPRRHPVTWRTGPWARFWLSCPGIFRCGRSSAAPYRH